MSLGVGTLVKGVIGSAGPGTWVPVTTDSLLDVFLRINSGSGTVAFTAWLEGTNDNNDANGYEIPADQVLESSSTATQNTTGTNKRDICTAVNTTSLKSFMACYKHVGFAYVRMNWILTGTAPILNVTAGFNGK